MKCRAVFSELRSVGLLVLFIHREGYVRNCLLPPPDPDLRPLGTGRCSWMAGDASCCHAVCNRRSWRQVEHRLECAVFMSPGVMAATAECEREPARGSRRNVEAARRSRNSLLLSCRTRTFSTGPIYSSSRYTHTQISMGDFRKRCFWDVAGAHASR